MRQRRNTRTTGKDVAKKGLQRMLVEMPLDEDERAAVEGGVEAMDALIAKRPQYSNS